MSVKIAALDHLVLTVTDLARSAAFYEAALGMRHETFTGTDGTKRHALLFGRQKINLHQAGAEFAPHARRPTVGSADLCFLLEGGMSLTVAALEALVSALWMGQSGARVHGGRSIRSTLGIQTVI